MVMAAAAPAGCTQTAAIQGMQILAAMANRAAFLVLLLVLACQSSQAGRKSSSSQGGVSKLWGKSGELYSPRGRLLDYSYAGYAAGEAPLPKAKELRRGAISVKQYGAKGDGHTDDSQAFQRAIDAVPASGGVVYVPQGKYVLTKQFIIKKRVIIHGDGSDKTTFYFPRPLSDVLNNHASRAMSFANFFIEFVGYQWWGTSRYLVAGLKSGAKRGDTCVTVTNWNTPRYWGAPPKGVRPKEWVVISLARPTDGSFLSMNQGLTRGCDGSKGGYCDNDYPFSIATRVVSSSGNQVCFERPLPWDLFANMPATMYRYGSRLSKVGVDGITMKFPAKRYPGHFQETGQSGINLHSVVNGFIRDVKVVNADLGLGVQGSMFVTVTDVELSAEAGRQDPESGRTGHIGLYIISSMDCVYQRFNIKTTFEHDLSVGKVAARNVFTEGKGVDINMDHHRAQNYANLFTDIDVGKGTRPFLSGGNGPYGTHCGSYGTFWHVHSKASSMEGPTIDFGPDLNIVGLGKLTKSTARLTGPDASGAVGTDATHTWLIEPKVAHPPNIYRAQQQARLGSKHKVSKLLGGKGKGGQPPFAPLK